MTSTFKPMSGTSIKDLYSIRYPKTCSMKLDGWRGVITPDGARTRAMKPFPNRHIQSELSKLPTGLDGEVAYVDDNGAVNFKKTASVCLNHGGTPKFCFFVFDYFWDRDHYSSHLSFVDRLILLRQRWEDFDLPDWVIMLSQKTIATPEEAQQMFQDARLLGHEGLVLRDPLAPYKYGKATLTQEWMLKMKPWEDTEGVVIDTVEEMFNANEATISETGATKRSSHQENKIPKGTLGALVVQSPMWPGKTFEIGTGFSATDRRIMWAEKPIGKTVKFSYIAAGGYDVPRHAVFLGFRAAEDMGE